VEDGLLFSVVVSSTGEVVEGVAVIGEVVEVVVVFESCLSSEGGAVEGSRGFPAGGRGGGGRGPFTGVVCVGDVFCSSGAVVSFSIGVDGMDVD